MAAALKCPITIFFPDYDAATGTEPARISDISFDYWEDCETGKGDCKPLTFSRNSLHERWFLLMPCGGTQTSVGLTPAGKAEPVRELNITSQECPPVFDITDLEDGKYTAYMLACGLGGPVEVNLITKQ